MTGTIQRVNGPAPNRDWEGTGVFVYETVRTLFLSIVRSRAIGYRTSGTDNVPGVGAAVLMSNHQSNFDPIMLGAPLRRPISIPGKAELFRIPVFRYFLRQLGSYPVDREAADTGSLRRSLKVLRAGKILAVFPEGTRTRTGEVGGFGPTLTKLALREGVPIVPVAIAGSGRILPPGERFPRLGVKTAVVYGEPIQTQLQRPGHPNEQEIARVTDLVRNRVVELLDRGNELIGLRSSSEIIEIGDASMADKSVF